MRKLNKCVNAPRSFAAHVDMTEAASDSRKRHHFGRCQFASHEK